MSTTISHKYTAEREGSKEMDAVDSNFGQGHQTAVLFGEIRRCTKPELLILNPIQPEPDGLIFTAGRD